jgi:hypothetical protein
MTLTTHPLCMCETCCQAEKEFPAEPLGFDHDALIDIPILLGRTMYLSSLTQSLKRLRIKMYICSGSESYADPTVFLRPSIASASFSQNDSRVRCSVSTSK